MHCTALHCTAKHVLTVTVRTVKSCTYRIIELDLDLEWTSTGPRLLCYILRSSLHRALSPHPGGPHTTYLTNLTYLALPTSTPKHTPLTILSKSLHKTPPQSPFFHTKPTYSCGLPLYSYGSASIRDELFLYIVSKSEWLSLPPTYYCRCQPYRFYIIPGTLVST